MEELSSSPPPSYTALSYVWGDPTDRLPITFNDTTASITKSLYAALEYLRSETEERTLWIDALCIDQSRHTARKRHASCRSWAPSTAAQRTPASGLARFGQQRPGNGHHPVSGRGEPRKRQEQSRCRGPAGHRGPVAAALVGWGRVRAIQEALRCSPGTPWSTAAAPTSPC